VVDIRGAVDAPSSAEKHRVLVFEIGLRDITSITTFVNMRLRVRVLK
jgi:hypothetical protein